MIPSTSRFSGKAEIYEAFRPSYPSELLDWLYDQVPCDSVCDIAAGTGLFTRALQRKPWSITAVEPNADMLRVFRQNLPTIPVVQSCAEATGLPSNAFGLVTIAQAFHWVDETLFQKECARILSPHGKLAILWNNRTPDGIAVVRDEICRHFCPQFRKGHVGKRTIAEGDAFLRETYLQNCTVFSIRHSHSFTEEAFVGETLSRSYALDKESPQYNAFVQALQEGFRREARSGIVNEWYEATAYLGSIS